MAILTTANFRAKHQIDASVADAVFESEVALADAMLADWFGTTAYTAAEDGSNYAATVIKSVGNYLALYFALPALATRVIGNGIALIVAMPDGTKVEDVTSSDLEVKREALMKSARSLAKTIPVLPAFYSTRNVGVLLSPME